MITTEVLTGGALIAALDDVARLRMEVLREWSYLYDGDLEYEREYLTAYQSSGAVAVAALDGGRVVGARPVNRGVLYGPPDGFWAEIGIIAEGGMNEARRVFAEIDLGRVWQIRETGRFWPLRIGRNQSARN